MFGLVFAGRPAHMLLGGTDMVNASFSVAGTILSLESDKAVKREGPQTGKRYKCMTDRQSLFCNHIENPRLRGRWVIRRSILNVLAKTLYFFSPRRQIHSVHSLCVCACVPINFYPPS